jgi:hypothetical protein
MNIDASTAIFRGEESYRTFADSDGERASSVVVGLEHRVLSTHEVGRRIVIVFTAPGASSLMTLARL